MKISLIIPAYNEESCIGACLESVLKNGAGLHEIIVVNNASSDNTETIAKSYPGVRVVTEHNKGVMKARQRGFVESRGDIVAFIDADTAMPEGWTEKILNRYNKDPRLVCISGPYKYYDGSRLHRFTLASFWWLTAPVMYRLVGYMVLGGNFAAKKDALTAMGGFDTSIDFYGDDTDIARRLHKHGKVLWHMDFFIHTSTRRFAEEGLFLTNARYALNFIWPVLFHRPFTKKHQDVRAKTINKAS